MLKARDNSIRGLHFTSLSEKKKIQLLGQELLSRKEVDLKALEFGEKFRKEIEEEFLPKVSAQFIDSEVGCGVFAEEFIRAGSFVGQYTGTVCQNIRTYFSPLNDYLMEYPVQDKTGKSYVIDATKGNLCRLINHSYQPNLQICYGFIEGFFHAILLSLRDIYEKEQLFYDYGRNYWALRGPPASL